MNSGMYLRLFAVLFILLISFNADAKRKKKNNKKPKVEKTTTKNTNKKTDSSKLTNTIPSPAPAPASNQETIKPFAQIVVSFASMGAGIDAKARQQFLDHITWFNEKNHCELMFDKKTWGREGEVDYCFYGNNEILMPGLFKELKEKLSGAKKVFIKQNFPCK